MIGIVFALFSAVASALGVVLVAKHSKESNPLYVSIIITSIGLVVMLPLAILLTDFSTATLEAMLLFAVSGVLTPGLARLFYYNGLRKLGSSVNSSIFSFYPIYGAFLAILFLNEVLTGSDWLGITAIVSGVIIMEMGCKGSSCSNSGYRDWGLPIIGGIIFAISAIVTKMALNIFNAPILGITIAYTFALVPYIAILSFNRKSRNEFSVRKNLKLFWMAGIGIAIGWILTFEALSLASVAIVIPLNSLEPLFIVLFAFFYLKQQEQLSHKLIAGIVIAFLGVLLIII